MSRQTEDTLLMDFVTFGRRVLSAMGGKSVEDFRRDSLEILGVLYTFTVFGEIVNRLGKKFQANHPEIPWAKIVSFRNKVVHGYDVVDFEILHKTIHQDLPLIVEQMEKLLLQLGDVPPNGAFSPETK